MTLPVGPGWWMRRATRDDNDALCTLFAEVPMGGAVTVAQERAPDFFQAPGMHGGTSTTFVIDTDRDGVVGCGTYVARPGRYEDATIPIGYVCDIRMRPAYRGARIFPAMAQAGLEEAKRNHGVGVSWTAVVDGNHPAWRATVRRTGPRRVQPVSVPVTPYWMASVQIAGARSPPRHHVRPATEDDMPALVGFVETQSQDRLFAMPMDVSALRWRLRHWPGFSLSSFRLAFDDRKEIAGVAAEWDTSSFRRSRCVAYSPLMRAYRAWHGVLARRNGWPGLPDPGEHFRFHYMTHLEVRDDDPSIFQDLLLSFYEGARLRGDHFLAMMVPRASRLRAGLRGFRVDLTPITLYATSLVGSEWNDLDLRTTRPGFEMALA